MMSKWNLFCVSLLLACVFVQQQRGGGGADALQRVKFPRNTTWANLAWGWDDGGADSTDGMKAILLDIDSDKSKIPGFLNSNRIVICYFSVGTLEPWRKDCKDNKSAWKAAAVGTMSDWEEEWLDIRNLTRVKALLKPRFDRAVAQGCHAIEPDNTDCYQNKDCWGTMRNPKATSSSVKPYQLAFNKWLSNYAHSKGLSIALKNTVGMIKDLNTYFDFAINEECGTWSECDKYGPFTSKGKAVFHVEYQSKSSWCDTGSKYKLRTKYCSGNKDDGLCTSGAWKNCFSKAKPLPPTTYKTY